MQNAADEMHLSLVPWYSSLIPNLPNFQPLLKENDGDLYKFEDGSYVKTPSKSSIHEQKMKEDGGFMTKLISLFQTSVNETKAKGKHSC